MRFFVRSFPDTDLISRQHVVYLKSKCAVIGSDAPAHYLDPTILYPIESMLLRRSGNRGTRKLLPEVPATIPSGFCSIL